MKKQHIGMHAWTCIVLRTHLVDRTRASAAQEVFHDRPARGISRISNESGSCAVKWLDPPKASHHPSRKIDINEDDGVFGAISIDEHNRI